MNTINQNNNLEINLNSIVKIMSYNVEIDWFSPFRNINEFSGVGTGFFIDDQGHILTCAHVIIDSIKTYISIPAIGKKKIPVDIISICPEYDIALLKLRNLDDINKHYHKYLQLINSTKFDDKVKQGDTVTAIGYPLSSEKLKYTGGMISGIDNIMIQTDTAINPGNSGGPLVNQNNQVIAINSAKIPSHLADNIGYAIPIYYFKLIEHEMKSGKKIINVPEWICLFQEIDKYIIEYYKNGQGCEQGYLVKDISKSSPLYTADVRNNNILCSFLLDNQYIANIDNFGEVSVPWSNESINIHNFIKRFKFGESIKIKFWKPKKLQYNDDFNFTPSTDETILSDEKINYNDEIIIKDIKFDNEDPYKIKYYYPIFQKIDYEIIGGIVFMDLTINHIDNWGESMKPYAKNVLESFKGMEKRMHNMLLVANILNGSYVNSTGILTPGDIIHKINGYNINSISELRDKFKKIIKLYIKFPNKEKFIRISTKSKNQIVLDITYITQENEFLFKQHKYHPTILHLFIKDAIQLIK
jgi:S1-C subfamily serine protease